MPPHRHAYRPVVMGRRGAVASAHPIASMAGIRVLLEGGNAVDAAVAVGSTLNVVEPFMSSAGGIGLMVISRGGKERHMLDFIGLTPAAADATRATADELAGGPKSCATPGNLGGWLAALERFGSMPRDRVFGPAIEWAEQGGDLQGAREHLSPGCRRGQRSLLSRADREGYRARRPGGRRLAGRTRSGGLQAHVARAHSDRLSRLRRVFGAPAVLGVPDDGDAQYPR